MQVLLLGLLIASASSAAAACPSQPRTSAGALATERAWVAALEHRDAATLACILDPTFSDNDWRGQQVPRDAILARLADRPPTQLQLSELKVIVESDMAVVRGLNTQTGSDGKVAGPVRFTDVFVYRAQRWKAIAAQETLVRPGP